MLDDSRHGFGPFPLGRPRTLTDLLGAPEPPRLASLYGRLLRPALLGVLTVLSLVVVAPLIGVIALLNWAAFRDWEKVFFHQERMGRHAQPFRMWKFRTMRDPEEVESRELDLAGLTKVTPSLSAEEAQFRSWGTGADLARTTRFGSFLRKTHLDELPQIWNILCGDMALIGPRPEMTKVHEWAVEHVPGFASRLWLAPGITGLAQVTQGYAAGKVGEYERKLATDLEYLARLSFMTDLRILLGTPLWMLRRRGWQRAETQSSDVVMQPASPRTSAAAHPEPAAALPASAPPSQAGAGSKQPVPAMREPS